MAHRSRQTVASDEMGDVMMSSGRVGESLGLAKADVDGQVDEDVRHLGAITELHRPRVGAVEHAGWVRLHDTR
jgi:hypothetical protein